MRTKTLHTAMLLALILVGGGKILAQNTVYGHEYVDLGLPSGTRWATMNIGAATLTNYGEYYAWGETEPKDSCLWSNYKWCDEKQKITKYATSYSYASTVDNKTRLDPEDDVAQVLWGRGWRMPTMAELDELLDNCTWVQMGLANENGDNISVWRATSNINGHVIYFPMGGYRENRKNASFVGTYGNYWTSDCVGNFYTSVSLYLAKPKDHQRFSEWRSKGFNVRPVISSKATTIVPIVEGTGLLEIPSDHLAALEALTYVGEMTLQNIGGLPHYVSKGGKELFSINSEWKVQIADGVTSADNITHELTDAEREMIVSRFTAAEYPADQIAAAKEWYTIGVQFPVSTDIREITNEEAGAKNASSARYNLSGQRVGSDYKGIVIENGKKRIIK